MEARLFWKKCPRINGRPGISALTKPGNNLIFTLSKWKSLNCAWSNLVFWKIPWTNHSSAWGSLIFHGLSWSVLCFNLLALIAPWVIDCSWLFPCISLTCNWSLSVNCTCSLSVPPSDSLDHYDRVGHGHYRDTAWNNVIFLAASTDRVKQYSSVFFHGLPCANTCLLYTSPSPRD